MSQYRTLNRTLLLKAETTPGTDASPTVGSDAVLCEDPVVTADLQSIETNEVTGSLDDRGSIRTGALGRATFTVIAKHSGAAGTAPEIGPSLRCCGMQETVTAAAITGTASAGTTSTITIEGADISSDDQLNGMPIRITSGTNSGYQGFIIDSVDSGGVVTVCPPAAVAFDNTSVYSIDINVRYAPESSGQEWASIYGYEHRTDAGNSRLTKIVGAQGTWTLSLPVRDVPRFSFDFVGRPVAPSDVSHPGAPTYDSTTAFPFLDAGCYLTSGASVVKINNLSVDYGAAVQAADDPSDDFGYDIAGITRRRVGGTIVPPKSLLSAFNPFTSWQNQTEYGFAAWWGPSAGNRMAIIIPALRFQNRTDQDVNGFAYDSLPFRSITPNQGVFVTFW